MFHGSVKAECFMRFRGWLLNLGGGSSVSPSLRAGLVFDSAGPAFLQVVWAGQVALVCNFRSTVIGLIVSIASTVSEEKCNYQLMSSEALENTME